MTKKKKSIGKIVVPKEKILESTKERFNPFQTGHGAHRDKTKYNRKRSKKSSWD